MDVTVDAVVFAYIEKKLNVLLIKRAFKPFFGEMALPGGYIADDEHASDSIRRKLKEETNIDVGYLEQLFTFTRVNRDPRNRTISIAYYALINPKNHLLLKNEHALEVKWVPYDVIMNIGLAFDHSEIIRYAKVRLSLKIKYQPIGFELLPKQFSMSDLYDFYVSILGDRFDRRNFIKKINGYGLLKKTPNKTGGHVGRKAQLFEFNKEKYDKLLISGFNFDI